MKAVVGGVIYIHSSHTYTLNSVLTHDVGDGEVDEEVVCGMTAHALV